MVPTRFQVSFVLWVACWHLGCIVLIPHINAGIEFGTEIQPILDRYCGECHNEDRQKAGLDLSSAAALLRGSRDGPVVVPLLAKESLMLRLLREGKMPPEKTSKRPSKAEIDRIRQWVEEGAQLSNSATKERAVSSHDALPILHLRCAACHGRQKQEAGLDLRSLRSIKEGSDSGAVVVSGDPESSVLIQKIAHGEMPPKRDLVKASVKVVRPSELEVLRSWIRGGMRAVPASDSRSESMIAESAREFWSFRAPVKPAIPGTAAATRQRNPVDRFVLHRLAAAGLSFAPEASPAVLLRRASFDLRGQPPTQEELNAFLADERPDAYERLIDRLLASPAYGERWGRYWLDLAGYSESEGMQHADEIRPAAYRYRDYVIQSLNADKSYRRFVIEQLAGDELVDLGGRDVVEETEYQALVATGFLRMVPDGTNANITNFVPHRLDVIANEMQVLGSGLMGLTLHCARCHSHKFDPIPQRDYARLRAVFKPAYDEHDWLSPRQRRLEIGRSVEVEQWRQSEAMLDAELRAVKEDDSLDDDGRKQKVDEINSKRTPKPFVRALWDRGAPSETFLLTRGDYLSPSSLVAPGVPEVLASNEGEDLTSRLTETEEAKTGRRLAFANWLTRDDHPLTARVIVNRVWKHHFGKGIVRTLDNFGKAGDLPSHPELLDWMAQEFVEADWSLKALHRLMMTSRTYRQSSLVTAEMNRLDPDNRLLSRMPLRRLEGEVLRDTMLLTAERMEDRPFGPSDDVDVSKEGLIMARANDGAYRRSIYLRQRRTEVPTLLESFDLPTMSPNCVERSESTVATQALHLLNNQLIYELASSFAKRLEREHPNNLSAQIRLGYVLAIGRHPTIEESEAVSAAVRRANRESGRQEDVSEDSGLAMFCHALFNSAAFIYVD